ncbi:MAG TPA: tRNA modification GTPase [Tepidisphaeraceae bacterium]
MNTSDTIAAISSAVGSAARMIVRAAGPLVPNIHRHLTDDPRFVGGLAKRHRIHFANISVATHVYTFAAPRSVSGDDVLELHIPGNPLLARILLEEIIRLGARPADPGEFTARAYFNGRIDLSEAEGVAATIAAQNQQQLQAARQLMSGELARRLEPMLDELTETLALLEANIDFSEEEISFLSRSQITQRIERIDAALSKLIEQSARFERLTHEPRIVLIGRPNAGKSTLLNALCGYDRAVVSPQAGTTRDVIWANVRLPRGMVRMIDVAGLEESTDEISHSMQQHARRAMETADIVVHVRDCMDMSPDAMFCKSHIRIATKIDLAGQVHSDEIPVSAATGENLAVLRDRLDALAFGDFGGAATLALNSRHIQAIENCRAALSRATQYGSEPEVIAMELREALDALGQVLGNVTPDDVLGKIFATFCIGK